MWKYIGKKECNEFLLSLNLFKITNIQIRLFAFHSLIRDTHIDFWKCRMNQKNLCCIIVKDVEGM